MVSMVWFIFSFTFRQDRNEALLDEMRKKDQEILEMREFTELERECERETIANVTEVRSTLQ